MSSLFVTPHLIFLLTLNPGFFKILTMFMIDKTLPGQKTNSFFHVWWAGFSA